MKKTPGRFQVSDVIKVTGFRLTDGEFGRLCEKIGIPEEEMLDAMVDFGWAIGLTDDGKGNIFWPPEPMHIQILLDRAEDHRTSVLTPGE